ncbi:unannotated protein [freshwater metagenome]|uniref:Unannotated protein n=1 Tax=freshwater metagenome TaxID=449393 RepID=A0A6J6ZAI3_9ZZZZ
MVELREFAQSLGHLIDAVGAHGGEKGAIGIDQVAHDDHAVTRIGIDRGVNT